MSDPLEALTGRRFAELQRDRRAARDAKARRMRQAGMAFWEIGDALALPADEVVRICAEPRPPELHAEFHGHAPSDGGLRRGEP